MNMIWLRQARETFSTRIDQNYDPKARFENDHSKLQGQVHALRKFLPLEYREMWDNGGTGARNWLSDTVSGQSLCP